MEVTVQNNIARRNPSRLSYIAKCTAFCGLYFLRDIVGIGVHFYIIYAFAAFIVLTASLEECVAFFVSIMAFEGAGFDGMFSVILLFCIFLRFFGHCRYIGSLSVMLIFMCAIEIFHHFNNGSSNYGTLLTYTTVLLCLLMVQCYPWGRLDKVFIVNSFICFSLFFVMMLVLRMTIIYGSFSELIRNGFRTEEYKAMSGNAAMNANQNYITSLCSLNLTFCILMLSKKMRKMPYIIAMVLFFVIALLTVSKMFMVVLAFMALFAVYALGKKKLSYGIAALFVIVVAAVLVIQLFGETLLKTVIERFLNEDLTSGRTGIIDQMFEYMNAHKSTYFIGSGIGYSINVLENAIHSSVFEVLFGWGFLGLFVAISYIWVSVKKAKYNVRCQGYTINEFNYFPLLMFLGYSLIGMLFSSETSIVQLTVCIYALQIKENA